MTSSNRPVLIVEDNPIIRDALVVFLEELGYATLSAGNGQDALDRLRGGGSRPCLIVLDLRMPVKDGWQFRAEQLRDPALAAIPVVVCSAENDVAKHAASLGAADYLQKPAQLAELLEVVERYAAAPSGTARRARIEPANPHGPRFHTALPGPV